MLNRAFTSNSKLQTPNSKLLSPFFWLITMLFVFYGWLLFRAQSLEKITATTRAMCHFAPPGWLASYLINLAVFVLPLAIMEFWQAKSRNYLVALTLPQWTRSLLQGMLLLAIALFWEPPHKEVPFIYFQF